MFLLCVFVYFFVVGKHGCSQLDENSSELQRAEWKCDAVCEGSGGKAAFDLKNKICKCALDKNTDDVDVQLILKYAELVGMPLVITKNIVKRQTISDPVVGQRAPPRIITPGLNLRTTARPFRFTPNRALPATSRFPTPTVNTDVQRRLHELEKRISDRMRSRSRSRTGPHLQQRAGFPAETRPNLMERLRQIQKGSKNAATTAVSNIAAPAPRKGSSSHSLGPSDKSNMDSKGSSKKFNSDIVTQDPSLYDKDV